jgi:hypothetical protein
LRLTSIQFVKYRGLADYHLGVDEFNVLVGPNNCGKSTIVSALRYLSAAIMIARSKRPVTIEIDDRDRVGHWVPEHALPSALDSVHTELEQTDSDVVFRFGSGRTLELRFPADGGCCLLLDPNAPVVDSAGAFRRHYNFRVSVLPVMSALADDEELLDPEYVRRWAGTPRSSRHFRNRWWYARSAFDEFRELLMQTWPEITDISPPTLPEPVPPRLVMFCVEEGRPREVQWAGFGFQVWCQLLTHILQFRDVDLLVIDEPEIYLHPDVQRRLVVVLGDVVDSRAGHEASDCGVRTSVIVEVDEAAERVQSVAV